MTTLAEALTFSTRTAEEIAQLAAQESARYLLSKGGSKTIAKALRGQVTGPATARVLVPHYWALYVHDGRGAVQMPPGRFMVFFPDFQNDPRTDFGKRFPVRLSDVQRLTRNEFIDGLNRNTARRASGQSPFMIVTKSVGPIPGVPFFTEGLKNFSERIGPKVQRDFRDFMALQLKGLNIRDGVSGSIG